MRADHHGVYRAIVLARMGTVLESHQFSAISDSAALERARDYLTSQHVEVWQASRFVGLLTPTLADSPGSRASMF
jgi:hypothetical protein